MEYGVCFRFRLKVTRVGSAPELLSVDYFTFCIVGRVFQLGSNSHKIGQRGL